jgi:hypothetical protein
MAFAMSELSQAGYAAHRGISSAAVKKAIDAERIPAAAVRRDGRSVFIDVERADLALGENIARLDEREKNSPNAAAGDADEGSGGAGGFENPHAAGLTKARTATEVYKARLAGLEYAERVGKVVAVEDLTRSMEVCAASMVRVIDQWPARADDLAAAFSRGGIEELRQVLKSFCRELRNTLAENMRLLGKDEGPSDDGDSDLQ